MKSSTFNLAVAVWCAGVAAFSASRGVDTSLVALNAALALFNLWLGLVMHKRGM